MRDDGRNPKERRSDFHQIREDRELPFNPNCDARRPGGLQPDPGAQQRGEVNILRAPNLFFNGFVDEDSNALDLSVDFTSHVPKREKRVVSVTVGLGIGGNALGQGHKGLPTAQSYMLLHILNLVDKTRRAGNFGWVQASVWAVEEPGSLLHAGRRAQFSSDLRERANDERRQILVTTHQDEFVRVADTAWLATPSTNGT